MNITKKISGISQTLQRVLKRPVSELLMVQNDVLAMQRLQPLYSEFIPWTSSALRPAAVELLLNDITINDRRVIVEFGSGVSTFFIAALLQSRRGHLFSVEHDPKWASIVRKELERRGLLDHVTLIKAPLETSPFGTQQGDWHNEPVVYTWYDTAVLEQKLPPKGIDLVVVDGPPAFKDQYRFARFPALPYIADRLASCCTIVLDDIDREGEQTVVAKWEEQTSFRFQVLTSRGNIAVSHTGRAFNI
ncbi:class I SAM-dependent methyltransferase [Persicimonas caeni]|uniref:Class I SAM-dependent methyltransferase n=1 Tax=Persicimonas caeni TaxID=2292766 RepID=A0A4Y6PTP4_PERCE|nr:class I SAM-dependent methyltransferase [Persicimonas caeni]QDG51704.1 class I SAM-dependent methyltransferase [Persicimonas caeni]QED32925.1 class I SAM-dependent methyltransferase [Persicimonas caeni]